MSVQPLPIDLAAAAQAAQLQLHQQGQSWWRQWDHAAIDDCCNALPANALAGWPVLGFWRGLASFMANRGDALSLLDQAWAGFNQRGDAGLAHTVAATALAISQADVSAQSGLIGWLARAELPAPPPADDWQSLWASLGSLAAVALGAADSPAAAAAANRLIESLTRSTSSLAPDERLLIGQLLLEYNFTRQQFHQTELLASVLEAPPAFGAASAHMRGRWHYTHGYVHYQTGEADRAEQRWQTTLALAGQHGLQALQVQAALALARRMLETARLNEADALLATLQPRWGGGRIGLLIHLLQTRARLLMLRMQPARALQVLNDALQLARDAAVPPAEQASCLTDLAEVLVALDRSDEALALLQRLASQSSARNAQVFDCLAGLLQAWQWRHAQPQRSQQALASAMQLAQAARFSMFFRQSAALAAGICALALASGIATAFVLEVVRARRLPAPADAGPRWPWPLWLRLLGSFELHADGSLQRSAGKTPHKPLELLRLLASERGQSMALGAAAQALWSDAQTTAGLRNLEVAVHRLRKLLPDAGLVWVGDGRIGLDNSRASSDLQLRRVCIDRIEALAMQTPTGGDGALATAAETECRSLMALVAQAGSGELLPGAPDAHWLQAQRRRCSQDTVRAALCAATVLARAQAHEVERSVLEAALHTEPLADALVQRLMQLHRSAGRPADAMRVFETHRKHLHLHGAQPGRGALAQWHQLQCQD